ncbi:TIR domain-containing protein [Commensalibacter intestini]|uniref:TIR domain-containing protein n=1 Tax=Commensalibacter intestini TaxID=479936 RepID=UPI00058D6F6E|nr:TIR domain-containing protein [Commensalibacter intestini]
MIKRNCFYSFHYIPDNWRAGTIRSIGSIEGNEPTSDNDWEKIKNNGDKAIKDWINSQMDNKSCVIVLIGSETANRKWINYEITTGWNNQKGVVGIYIHGFLNKDRDPSYKGKNPFENITFNQSTKKLSSIVKCYDPPGADSKEKYKWISNNIAAIVEEAIRVRRNFKP